MDEDKKSVVELAKERYQRAKDAYDKTRQLAIEDTKFAMGDSDNGWQWPEEIRQTRSADSRPCLTVNVTAQHCNQIINNIRQNRPAARVLPVDNKSDKKSAEIMAGLIRNIQTSSKADDAHDCAAEHAIYGGEGYWRILTEYESETSFNQVIKIKPVTNPLLVYIDPDCTEIDKSDAAWGFLFEDITKAQCKKDHPNIDPSSWVEDQGWVKPDTVRRAEYFYREEVKDTACLMPDGSTVLASEYEGAEKQAVQTRSTTRMQWKWCKLLGGHDEPLDTKDWAGKYLPIVSIVGKEININGEIVRKGIVRDLKDPARMVNYSYSAAIETVALQNKVPYMAAVEAIQGHEEIWGRANNENRAYLPFNAFDDDGQPIPMPQRQQPAVMPAAQVQMLQLSTEQMRAASGQQNANFGIKSEAQSGVGIQRLKVQGETATFHFPDNLTRGLRYEAMCLIDLIPKIYDTRRVVRILGLDGKDEQAVLDPEMPQPSAELAEQEISQAFNPSLGMYDVVIDTGPSFHTQRQEAAANLTELASKNPQLMQVAGDIIVRSYDFPMADELAKRLEKTVPPEFLEKEGQPEIPPQVQATMQQMGQQIEMLTAQLQEAAAAANDKQSEMQLKAAEIEVKKQDTEIKAFDAETKRMQVLMSAEQQAQQAEQQQVEQQIQGEREAQEQAETDNTAGAVTALAQEMGNGSAQVLEAVGQAAQITQEAYERTNETLQAVLEAISRPRSIRAVRGQDGKLSGAVSTMANE